MAKGPVGSTPEASLYLEYVKNLIEGFDELHGDRLFGDDQALVGGLGEFRGRPVMVIGHEKAEALREGGVILECHV